MGLISLFFQSLKIKKAGPASEKMEGVCVYGKGVSQIKTLVIL